MSAFNGSGTFVISGPGLPYVTATVISSTVANQLNTDLAAGLSNCLTKDGQTVPTNNIPMGGFRLTGLGAPVAPGDALVWGQPATISILTLTDSPFNITKNQDALTFAQITNNDAGGNARTAWRVNNGGAIVDFGLFGTNYTPAGIIQPNRGYISSSGDLAMFTAAAVPVLFGTNGLERMRIDGAGFVGIGLAPTVSLDVGKDQNGVTAIQVNNGDTVGNAVRAAISAKTGASGFAQIGAFGNNFTPNGVEQPSRGFLASAGVLAIYTAGVQPIVFGIAANEVGQFDSTGTLVMKGPTSGSGYSGTCQNGLGGIDIRFEQSNGITAANSGPIRVSKNAGNSRSINATGTINANGTDYAEYEFKAPGCGPIAAGQIVGFTIDGTITDLWASAVSFGVKTTDPSFVGGDAWASSLPERPEPSGMEEGPAKDAVVAALAQWFLDLTALEDTVDRIAYCGKVPVNVMGAAPGDYIMAVQNGTGIDGQIVAAPTLAQMASCVGRVRKILLDGRAQISIIMN